MKPSPKLKKFYLKQIELAQGNSVSVLEKRFQVLLTISLFLPTTIAALKGDAGQLNSSILVWGIVVALLIASYFFLEILRDKMRVVTVKIVDFLVMVNILAFAPLLFIVAQYRDILPSGVVKIFVYVLLSVNFIPLVILFTLASQFAVNIGISIRIKK